MATFRRSTNNTYQPYSVSDEGLIYLWDIIEDEKLRLCFFASEKEIETSRKSITTSPLKFFAGGLNQDFHDYIVSTGIHKEFGYFNACLMSSAGFVPYKRLSGTKSLENIVQSLKLELL